ncbi:hypothetical protein PI124_g24114, partial [Phytophthora idaei]
LADNLDKHGVFTPKKIALGSVPSMNGQSYSGGFTLSAGEPLATLDYDYEVAGLPYFVASSVSNGPVEIEVNSPHPSPTPVAWRLTASRVVECEVVVVATASSYILGQYDVPFNVKENVWYPVEIRVNSTAGNIVFSIDGQQVFDIILTEMGFTDEQLSFYGYASRGEGAIGFGGWQDQASYVRNVTATSLSDSSEVLYSNPMTDESVVVPEFGGQSNAYGVCLDGAKRDRYIWLGDFYHTTRIMGVANSKPEQIAGTWEFLFEYQADYGQFPGFAPISYQSEVYGVSATAFALTSGVANETQIKLIVDGLEGLRQGPGYLDTSDTDNTTHISPITNGFLLDALLQHGYTDQAVFLFDNLWDAMISNENYRSGASWEYVAQSSEPGIDLFTSLSHPWGGAPTYALTNYVAGIRPVEFGFRRWIVNPLVSGLNMTSASATVNTPYGDLSAAWEIVDSQLNVTITAPVGTDGTFEVSQPSSST